MLTSSNLISSPGKLDGSGDVVGYFPEDSSLEMPSPRDLQSPHPAGPNATPVSVLQDKNAKKKVSAFQNNFISWNWAQNMKERLSVSKKMYTNVIL